MPLIAVLSLLLAAVGCVGVLVPVLPGSLVVAVALLIWALVGGAATGWLAFGVGLALVAAGALAQYVLTGRTLKAREIPSWAILAGVALGLVGLFTVPVVGLPLGFAVGLFCAEWVRGGAPRRALATSAVALRSIGAGLLVEFCCAGLASGVLALSVAATVLGH